MTPLSKEIKRRRTFSIISHPDAGKTTLTEKLLLFAGAIHIAGSVKAPLLLKGTSRNPDFSSGITFRLARTKIFSSLSRVSTTWVSGPLQNGHFI